MLPNTYLGNPCFIYVPKLDGSYLSEMNLLNIEVQKETTILVSFGVAWQCYFSL
jgi:hypothetical protein